MKIAVVHDWLVTYAGAERVLASILALWPQADLFAVIDFLSDQDRARLGGKRATTTFIQRLPKARTHYQRYLPLMPLAIEQLDLSGYDLVISSSHAVAKGVLTGPDTLHISYVHSPIRYAWDLQHQYLNESGMAKGLKGAVARMVLHYMRLWDQRTAPAVDCFVANSQFIARRIEKAYRREAQVIYPPVDTRGFTLQPQKQDYYVTAQRMVPYKKVPMIVEAFAKMPDKRLVVIGDGPEMDKVRKAAGSNVTLLGQQPFDVLREHLQNAKGFVFAAEEDFGISPVEAQACGTPVIAFGRGGVLETVRGLEQENPTGVLYREQSATALAAAVQRFEREHARITAQACRDNAERFSERHFEHQLRHLVDQHLGLTAEQPALRLAAASA
ncbi:MULTISPECIES: glycosyltransferase family 4 protein [unclassified Pseudomonas]|uniref:glycosyltransferase family 4 protein n=1 Tax=unclassified Pseudomonas TaxID=196821 RepID=UPI000BC7A221|nr:MULTISPECIES: glycosyltransferase family 4 protein [unclassified Pseudomonas]PVZ15706.1 glycosyltransferase involved in cell wall biosynthesis [Pseudomonas sp. URIL14HWK12:I12]PVZ25080.1 glycosyltransferase involved in cell wall biosynthesis [Pseudomonas sp. URIL14HWK12:I10]PVZ34926.1 glycosyltransferase involved in cell wall biosynthesis [Pseudomonas sp. URIL14HWK12:I11]SNZ09685.1 Glycosyltransferase involved in cell wall bisynthesis [Pseudomonas sp. URIL14HWK12:I9]